ncbi:hypothetical protein H0I31_00705 [Tenacibaculum sp. AHE15PA]|uniref:hypothetical protein n=1 Tax=unclassified Tenacibaculum TaxID=2635139 RepID=UPI001C4FE869|nr:MULTISPECIES: hypothetical protein [unclassified Tenacibaculum]QXP74667.1 hypothetical protein H0I30_05965 [Tenacibaculum sp. AHE14PA]QXP76178.1 hypothetical protein H0I31_00705 [Tenacibaculum sp. AHE15PA]
MKIVDIFAIVNDSLYSVQYDGKPYDEFKMLFDQWQDIEYLEGFFENNKKDLAEGFYKDVSIEDAILRTTNEASKFEQKIRESAENSICNPDEENTLEKVVFKSLHKDILNNDYIESKAYGVKHKSWLRIYAIRLIENVYFVSGGGIKLTKDMTPEHLKDELKKLKATTEYLKENFIVDEDDLGYIELGSYGEE